MPTFPHIPQSSSKDPSMSPCQPCTDISQLHHLSFISPPPPSALTQKTMLQPFSKRSSSPFSFTDVAAIHCMTNRRSQPLYLCSPPPPPLRFPVTYLHFVQHHKYQQQPQPCPLLQTHASHAPRHQRHTTAFKLRTVPPPCMTCYAPMQVFTQCLTEDGQHLKYPRGVRMPRVLGPEWPSASWYLRSRPSPPNLPLARMLVVLMAA